MWENFEARLEENERDRPIPLRRTLFDVLRGSGLRPGDGVTKKMARSGRGDGFATELRPYQSGMKDGERLPGFP